MNHWIEAVFRAADAADPGAKLCYDDHNTDGLNAKSTGIFRLVESTGGYLPSRVRLVAPYGSSGYRPVCTGRARPRFPAAAAAS